MYAVCDSVTTSSETKYKFISCQEGASEASVTGDEYQVILSEVGPNKVKVIKVVRELTGLGLTEAKELVESAPSTVLESVSQAEALEAKTKLEDAGATVFLVADGVCKKSASES
jgi:large subunit ribosomal protein L7/L12